MILMDDHLANLEGPRYLLYVSSIVGLSFRRQSSKFSMVILYSSLCLSEIAMPSIQEFLIIGLLDSCSVLSGFSLSSVFWKNNVYAVSVILL